MGTLLFQSLNLEESQNCFSLVAFLKLSKLLTKYDFDNEVGIIGNALFFLRMLSMCKHVYIAHFGIRFAQLVICMRLNTDRIQKSKIHFYCFE